MRNSFLMDKLFLSDLYINPTLLYWSLQQQPELWNQNTSRTESPKSPHREMDDIWVRSGEGEGAFHSEWLEPANKLPLRPIVSQMMLSIGAAELGGILITRVPPGKTCYPHIDQGWHASYYDKMGISNHLGTRAEILR